MFSSDSEDENMEMFKEVIDPTFFTNDLYNQDKSATVVKPVVTEKHSLRHKNEDSMQNELRVTPEFQKFVAKHLSKLIESSLKEIPHHDSTNEHENSNEDGGIKLLSSSLCYASADRQEFITVNRHRRSKNHKRDKPNENSSSDEDMDKFAAAAVSPEWILSKEAIKGWSIPTRGEVITIRIPAKNEEKKKKKKKDKENSEEKVLDHERKNDVNIVDSKNKKSEKRKRQRLKMKQLSEQDSVGPKRTEKKRKQRLKKKLSVNVYDKE